MSYSTVQKECKRNSVLFATFWCFSKKFKEISSETTFCTKFDEIFERSIVLIKMIRAVFRKTMWIFRWNIIENKEFSGERVRTVAKSRTKIHSINNVRKQI